MRPHFKKPTAEQLPLILTFLLLLVPLGLSPLYLFGDTGRKILKALDGQPLTGIQPAAVVELTASNWWSGNLHKQAETWINQEIPLRPRAVRATNQFYYSLFAKSYMNQDELIIGKTEQLYAVSYVSKYCTNIALKTSFFQPLTPDEINQWSAQVKEVETFFKGRGQTFIYVLTASKAAYYPEYIPDEFKCNPATPRSDDKLAIAALEKLGVPYVDTNQLTIDGKGKYPVELYPQGGIHWNDLGSAIASREVLAKIAELTGKPLPPIEFSYTIDRNPTRTDTDLLDLLNLWSPNRNYPVPKLNFKTGPKTSLSLAFVGGSFANSLRTIFSQTDNFCRMDHYRYFSIIYLPYPREGADSCGVDDAPNSYQNLLTANIVILEENSDNIRSKHLQLLRAFISTKTSTQPSTQK
jgi:alginate O-acetyltransferase complex protein AlgJ